MRTLLLQATDSTALTPGRTAAATRSSTLAPSLPATPSSSPSVRATPSRPQTTHTHALPLADHAAKLHDLPDEHLGEILATLKKIAVAQGVENYNILQVS